MLERNARDVDLPALITATRADHPRQATQEPARAVRHASGDQLRDDATVVCLDRHGSGHASG